VCGAAWGRSPAGADGGLCGEPPIRGRPQAGQRVATCGGGRNAKPIYVATPRLMSFAKIGLLGDQDRSLRTMSEFATARVSRSGPKSLALSIDRISASLLLARLTRLLMVPTAHPQI